MSSDPSQLQMYGGRHSDNRQRQKKGPIGRPSMDRAPRQSDLLKRTENAWKPQRKVSKLDGIDPEELKKQVRAQKSPRPVLS